MLVLKYFVVVGGLMVAGLMALNAHMAPSGSVSAAAVTHASSAASLAIVPPKPAPVVAPAAEPPRRRSRSLLRARVIPPVPRRPTNGRVDRGAFDCCQPFRDPSAADLKFLHP